MYIFIFLFQLFADLKSYFCASNIKMAAGGEQNKMLNSIKGITGNVYQVLLRRGRKTGD